MLITILEAEVTTGQADALQEAFQRAVGQLDPGIVETFLLRGAKDPDRWQIVTLWESRAALDAMRASGETPRGVQLFRAVGAEPVLSVFAVAGHGRA